MSSYHLGRFTSALNGKPAHLFISTKANRKVQGKDDLKSNQAVTFCVVSHSMARSIVENAPTLSANKMAVKFAGRLRDGGEDIITVCGGGCDKLLSNSCYVQHNVQALGEPMRVVRDALHGVTVEQLDAMTDGLDLRYLATILDRVARVRSGDIARLMIAGSTSALPVDMSTPLIATLRAHQLEIVAYVEQWRDRPDLMSSHMASVTTREEAHEAESLGWRTFLTGKAEDLGTQLVKGETVCPSSKAFINMRGRAVACSECKLCNGAKDGDTRSRRIVNFNHASGQASRIGSLVRKGKLSPFVVASSGRVVGHLVKDPQPMTVAA